MHMQGDPTTMQEEPRYDDVVAEVQRLPGGPHGAAVAAGIQRDHLCADPGIGFGKTIAHNLALLHDRRRRSASCASRSWWGLAQAVPR